MLATESHPNARPPAPNAAPDGVIPLAASYGVGRRLAWLVGATLFGVLVAGIWNYQFVDGIGRDMIAGGTIGDTEALAGSFALNGGGFGFLFAAVAGLAATFTACNCVVFAMLPGLACSTDRASGRRTVLAALGAFILGVVAVSIPYGAFVGFLGAEGIAAFNERAVRLARAQAIFSTIGVVMIMWGALEFGFLDALRRRFAPDTRAFLARPQSKALVMGVLVGLFSVGRPFPVMADFMRYAAEAGNPFYGAAVMAVQGLGQVAVMVGLFALIVWGLGTRLERWLTRAPDKAQLLGAVALVAGGVFFVYYWGLAFAFDIGGWGFKLGWYG